MRSQSFRSQIVTLYDVVLSEDVHCPYVVFFGLLFELLGVRGIGDYHCKAQHEQNKTRVGRKHRHETVGRSVLGMDRNRSECFRTTFTVVKCANDNKGGIGLGPSNLRA